MCRRASAVVSAIIGGLLLPGNAGATDPFNLDGLREMLAQRQAQLDERLSDPPAGQVQAPSGVMVTVYGVGLPTLVSAPGQTLAEFLQHRGGSMRERTRQTSWEVCARICQASDGRYALRPVTLRAALSCATQPSQCPAGFSDTGQSVHTHGAGPMIAPTAVDKRIEPGVGLTHVEPNALSPEDQKVPGTWLLTPDGQLLSNVPPVSVWLRFLSDAPWLRE